VLKWQEIDQDNLHIKFSALNVDFSALGPSLLHSTWPAHMGKSVDFCTICLFSMKMLADRHRHATYRNMH